ncbi:MAG: sugar phosphate isomerase/epimerase [Sulfitobacter sp. SK025]|nr:MAG: sugar phosphate isomerase/epimerase [Sulfitobacter sp. SK025]
MNRRSALKTMIGAAAVATINTKATAQAGTALWKTAIGLNGFSSSAKKYEKTFPIWEVLDYAARSGFDGVELMRGWPQGNYPKADETERIAALKRLYDQYGLQVFSLQASGRGAFSADQRMRKQFLTLIRDQVKFAKAVGCECIGLWPGGPLRGQTLDQAIKHFAGSMREMAKIADDAGLVAAFEIEPPFIFKSEETLVRILEEANDSRVKTIYDSSHFDLFNGSMGKPHEMLKRIGGGKHRLRSLHRYRWHHPRRWYLQAPPRGRRPHRCSRFVQNAEGRRL